MIRKLRIKLVIASMVSLLLVLLVIFGIVGILNYIQMVSNADEILIVLSQNEGRFSGDEDMDGDMDGGMDGARKEEMKGEPLPPENFHKQAHRFSAELPYEIRYFSVFLAQDGTINSVNMSKIAAVDATAAVTYAQTAVESQRVNGFIGRYRYMVYSVDGETHVFFLDCGREIGAVRTFLLTTAGVSAAGLLAVLLLLIFLSARIVKPFSENYEKQKQFITDAGHELKTPLTIIDADAQVMEMDMGENEWLSDIQTQTKRLAELTNSLILLSRMEEQPQAEKIEFPISDVAEETLETFQTLAKTRGKTLTGNIQPMLSMCGDEKAVRQLITILLDNAVKYSDEAGRIELTLEKKKGAVRLCVFNTAKFVASESLPRLFDRFYRADQSRNSKTGGYGLGLSIASAIVNAHKGKIAASTQDEKSLLITVTFPA